MISQELEATLDMAFLEARQQRHEFITVEHLLLALLDNPTASDALLACAADVENLRRSLSMWIRDNTPTVGGHEEVDTLPTLGFQRVIQRAIMHVQSTNPKRAIEGQNVLVAIFGENDSRSVHYLHGQGVTHTDVVNFIAHSIRKPAPEISERSEMPEAVPLPHDLPDWAVRPPEVSSTATPEGAAPPAVAQDLEVTLHMAFVEARRQRHEFITVEHLLLALLDNAAAIEVLMACGATFEDLRRTLAAFVTENTPTVGGTEEVDTEPTLGFQRVIQRALQNRNGKSIDGHHVLAALFGEKDSHAVYYLHQQGITRLDVVNFIAHGIRKVSGEPSAPGAFANAEPTVQSGQAASHVPSAEKRAAPEESVGLIADTLEVALRSAYVDARRRRHELMTVEHLLLALLDDPTTRETLVGCAADLDHLRLSLSTHIREHAEVSAGTDEVNTQPTLGFQRVIQSAIMHVQSSGRGKQVGGPTVLVALFGEKDSRAVACLHEQGVTRLDVVNFVSHGIRKEIEELPARNPLPDVDLLVPAHAAATLDSLESASSSSTTGSKGGAIPAIEVPDAPYSPELESALANAFAKTYRHGRNSMGTERLLLGLLDDGSAFDALIGSGVDVPALRIALSNLIPNDVPTGVQHDASRATPAVAETIQRGIGIMRNRGAHELRGSHVLLALYDQPQCAAAKLLVQQGATHEAVFRFAAAETSRLEASEEVTSPQDESANDAAGGASVPALDVSRLVQQARTHARAMGHGQIEPEDLLAALVSTDAFQLLGHSAGIDAYRLEIELSRWRLSTAASRRGAEDVGISAGTGRILEDYDSQPAAAVEPHRILLLLRAMLRHRESHAAWLLREHGLDEQLIESRLHEGSARRRPVVRQDADGDALFLRGPAEFPPVGASAWGDDEYGIWFDWSTEQSGVEMPDAWRRSVRWRWIESDPFPLTEDDRNSRARVVPGFWISEHPCRLPPKSASTLLMSLRTSPALAGVTLPSSAQVEFLRWREEARPTQVATGLKSFDATREFTVETMAQTSRVAALLLPRAFRLCLSPNSRRAPPAERDSDNRPR